MSKPRYTIYEAHGRWYKCKDYHAGGELLFVLVQEVGNAGQEVGPRQTVHALSDADYPIPLGWGTEDNMYYAFGRGNR